MNEDMDTDDPFARFGMGGASGMGGGFPRSFSSTIGGLGSNGRMVRKQQDPPVVYDLQVTLEEVLAGCTKKMKISRKRLNPDGRTIRKEDKILEVQIKKGWKEGTKITFPKEGDETPTNIPADVVFVLKDKPHAVFRRDGSDIIFPAKISLRDVSFFYFVLFSQARLADSRPWRNTQHTFHHSLVTTLPSFPFYHLQALCGSTVSAPTLEGRTLSVSTTDVVQPGSKRRISGEGLPYPKRPDRRGDLIVEYEVRFPERLSQSARDTIAQVLPRS